MLDDIRDQAGNDFFDDDDDLFAELPPPPGKPFLGMSAVQRFIIAVMLLMIVCLIGGFALLVTGVVVPPFL